MSFETGFIIIMLFVFLVGGGWHLPYPQAWLNQFQTVSGETITPGAAFLFAKT